MTAIFAIAGVLLCQLGASAPAPTGPVVLGVDRLLGPNGGDLVARLKDKRVALLTHAAAVDGALTPTADRLVADPRVQLVQLYAPEHGIRGALKAGEAVADTKDPVTTLPIQALWGKRRRPTTQSLKAVDVVLVDLQSLGSRTYTFESTLGELLMAGAQTSTAVWVLDRPNPRGGLSVEGPPIPEPPTTKARRRSMVGWGPVPVTHGLTLGELAVYYNDVLKIGCDLTVVPMGGWRRAMTWRDTGLHWVPTSPGIPHVEHADLYVATGMVGGVTTNINEGVGTTMPFETIAAEFIEPDGFARAMNRVSLPGVRFRAVSYRPYYHRHRRKLMHGVQLIVTDSAAFEPLRAAVTLLTEIERLYPGRVAWRTSGYVRRIWAGTDIQARVARGESASTIRASWEEERAAFVARRATYLLYP